MLIPVVPAGVEIDGIAAASRGDRRDLVCESIVSEAAGMPLTTLRVTPMNPVPGSPDLVRQRPAMRRADSGDHRRDWRSGDRDAFGSLNPVMVPLTVLAAVLTSETVPVLVSATCRADHPD
jgi:hypothetical protein